MGGGITLLSLFSFLCSYFIFIGLIMELLYFVLVAEDVNSSSRGCPAQCRIWESQQRSIE